MTEVEFQRGMSRMIENFGKAAYSTERARLIWREVQQYSAQWWTQAVDKFIGECRQPPLMPEIREAIAKEREREWSAQKKIHAKEAEDFFKSSYAPEDVRSICQTIIKRITGGIDDATWENIVKDTESIARGYR